MVGESFKEEIENVSRKNKSKLILALDISEENAKNGKVEEKCLSILDETSEYIAGVKIGYSLVLKTGIEIIDKISNSTSIPIIADFKIADIPPISQQIATRAYESGANAVISHGFTGEDSLEAIIQKAKEEGDKGVFVVSNMSHPGGKKFIQPVKNQILEMVKEAEATGIIGPATRPEQVQSLRSKAGEDLLILTPGIGAQGGKPGDAIKHGADYEIVGRAIYTSKSPKESAAEIRDEINENAEDRSY